MDRTSEPQFDTITRVLRQAQWTPEHRYPCGCEPTRLCKGHAERRAVDHYRTPGWS